MLTAKGHVERGYRIASGIQNCKGVEGLASLRDSVSSSGGYPITRSFSWVDVEVDEVSSRNISSV